jgi:hypothetical protein
MGFITEGLNCAGIGFMSRLFSDQKLTGFHTSRLVPLINNSLTTAYIYLYIYIYISENIETLKTQCDKIVALGIFHKLL